jgi:hypothetical protein
MPTEEYNLSEIKKDDPIESWLKEELYLNEPVIYNYNWKELVLQMAKLKEQETTVKILKQFKMTFADSWKRK